MSNNMEPERNAGMLGTVGGTTISGGQLGIANSAAGKIYPMDLAPQKITIVKSAAASGDNKLHLVTSQGKPHLLSQGAPISLVRPAPQIISQGIAPQQPQMIVSGTQLLSGSQLMNQGSQIISQAQIIGTGTQLLNPQTVISQSGQIINQGTQIISQGSQLMSQSAGAGGTQLLSVGGGGVVVSSGTTLRPLPPLRVLPPSTLSSPRPSIISTASSVTVTPLGSGQISKPSLIGMSSHVPRGPAAGASLAVPRASARPTTPTTSSIPVSTLGGWSARSNIRGPALVYPARVTPRGSAPRPTAVVPGVPVSTAICSALPQGATAIVNTVSSSGGSSPLSHVNASCPPLPPLASALPLQRRATLLTQPPRLAHNRASGVAVLQRNSHTTKVVTVGTRAPTPAPPLQRSALYYEMTRTTSQANTQHTFTYSNPHTPFMQHSLPGVSMTVVPVSTTVETRAGTATPPGPAPTPPPATAVVRPSILRKRDLDGSPSKSISTYTLPLEGSLGWSTLRADLCDEDDGDGGSTTVSAASSPGLDEEPPSPPRAPSPLPQDISPRKKPRKQMLSSEVRQCEFQSEEPPPSPPAPLPPPPRRSLIGGGWMYDYRATALHFTRPAEVRRKELKPPHVLELANEKHVLTKANGWKVHHLTAQMDDLVELESASCDQLNSVLRALDSTNAPHLHSIMELVKGNIQRSKIVCEDMREARADILRVFTHRTFVADILARQVDKRCFRKHRTTHT